MRLVLASTNAGKLRELQLLLEPMRITVHSQSEFNVPTAKETGLSFVENALLKARHCCSWSGLPSLSDDSGLVVDALNGAPGIYSARYAGTKASDADNIAKLLRLLRNVPDEKRTAHFHCSLALVRHPHDPDPLICQGRWQGRIAMAPSGEGGFGYDPVFIVDNETRSAAELQPSEKNILSHRGQAFLQLSRHLLQQQLNNGE